MKNSRGFTLLEMLVGGAILLIILLIATSFFMFQSRYGGQLVKDTGTRESLGLALMMIKRDVMHAGAGLNDQPELSLWVDDPVTTASAAYFRKLYVSYGGFLSTLAAPDIPNLNYNTVTNVYSVYGTKRNMTGAVFGGTTSVTQFIIGGQPLDICGVLQYDTAASPAWQALTWTAQTPATGDSGKTQFTIPATSTATTASFTPVISYQLVTKDTLPTPVPAMVDQNYPELRRNSVANASAKDVTVAGGPKESNMQLIDFRVRCQFIASDGTVTWTPTTGSTLFPPTTLKATDLRMVEVQIVYRTKRGGLTRDAGNNFVEVWSQPTTKTLQISPRNPVLARY